MTQNAYATAPETDLTEIFEAFARKAVADFPHLKGRFSLYSQPTNTHHGSFDNEEVRKHLLQRQRELAFDNLTEPGRPFAVQEDGCYLITYPGKITDYARVYTNPGTPYSEEIELTDDHELGHLVAPGGYKDDDRCENIAEAFALLRQLQKGSTIRETIGIGARIAVNQFITEGDASHFDLPVLQQAGRIAAMHDLCGLTPLQIANMAYRLSFLYAPLAADVRKLTEIFAPVMQGDNKTPLQLADVCANIMFEDHGTLTETVFAMGKIFLQPVLHARPDIELRIKGHIRRKRRLSLDLEQRLATEVKDLMVLGRFDKNPPGRLIDPAAYQSVQNLRYLQRAADVYAAIRYFQMTGKEIPHGHIKPVSIPAVARLQGLDIAGLGQRRAILLARHIASDSTLKTPVVKNSRKLSHAR